MVRLRDENNRNKTSLVMENERRNKTLSRVMIALGVIMSIGGIIALSCSISGLWSLPRFDSFRWLFGVIIGGFNIWVIGTLARRKHRMDKKTFKNFFYHKVLVALGLLGHLATAFGTDVMLIKDPAYSLSLNHLFIILLSGCLGMGLSFLSQTGKEQSSD